MVSTDVRRKHHDIAVVAPDKVTDPPDGARRAGFMCGLHLDVRK